ncbi:MAG: DUF1963 domain-containing protein [Lachnospiraceae bacterium]|nr:DUF1963 domain-containing protein [Lachnospiraceae bacterium]
MAPLATFFIKGLTPIPKELERIELITVFVSEDVFQHLGDVSDWFCIRTYDKLEELIPCDWEAGGVKVFPLVPVLVTNDYPMLDDEMVISQEIFDAIWALDDDIDYYEDIFEENYDKHKIGGYPSFCQQPYRFEDYEGYEYVFQISSDEKAKFNIVDDGNFYFFYNEKEGKWKVHCDFY